MDWLGRPFRSGTSWEVPSLSGRANDQPAVMPKEEPELRGPAITLRAPLGRVPLVMGRTGLRSFALRLCPPYPLLGGPAPFVLGLQGPTALNRGGEAKS